MKYSTLIITVLLFLKCSQGAIIRKTAIIKILHSLDACPLFRFAASRPGRLHLPVSFLTGSRRLVVLFLPVVIAAALFLFLPATASSQTACSKVSLEILQELTLERIAFDAKLVIANNVPDKDLTDVRVDVTIKDVNGNIKNDIFFTRLSSTHNIAAVDGTGIVNAATTAEAHWLIVPSPGAGGTDPAGLIYWVGATLTYTIAGVQEVVPINPDRIIVKPEAQLVLDYFQPYEVLADNPFTPEVEAPVPFQLAVRILNAGYGAAAGLRIDSAQPKIVENTQGLFVDFQLLGASVNDGAVSPSLTVPIGTLSSTDIATAYWEMISTLSGRFVEFSASFSHASELGGELTSLIRETNAHYLTHRVKVNLPGRDDLLDFLADVDGDPQRLPDTIFESQIPGGTGAPADAQAPVTVMPVIAAPGRPTVQSPRVDVQVQTGGSGWIYASFVDPSQGLLDLLDVVRADGFHLDPNNFWIGEGLDENYQRTFTLHLLDYRSDAGVTGTYALVFTQPEEDTAPPETILRFSGPAVGTDPVFITPETNILFTATDNDGGSGVDQMLRRIVAPETDFVAALPMTLGTPGAVSIEYYSTDRSGNQEPVRTANLFVDAALPVITTFQAVPAEIKPHAPAGVAAQRTTDFVTLVTDEVTGLQAVIDIAPGAVFSDTSIVRTISVPLQQNLEARIAWDGRDAGGLLVPTGAYIARLSVTDGLDTATTSHTASTTTALTVADWFTGTPLDPNPAGAQQHPDVSGTRVVWQDNRSGNWDVYLKETGGAASTLVAANAFDQERPSVDGDIIVWQDNRNGNADIYGYDLLNSLEIMVSTSTLR